MLFETLTEIAAGDDASPAWLLRPPYRPDAAGDVVLVSRRRDWRDDESALAALARIEAHPAVEGVVTGASGPMLRLSPECLTELAERLDACGPLEQRELNGHRYRVYFCDPNATKPLHVGHLRNVAIGNAVAAALEHAGADVRRRSTVADFGRSMAEAMAGVEAGGGLAAAGDEKGDHYVGRRYADYVAAHAGDAPDADNPTDAILGRELRMEADAANVLLRDLLDERPAATALWQAVRAAAIDGHDETLRTLGVRFDEIGFESELLAAAAELADRCVADGIFERTGDGAVVYHTGLESSPTIVMLRSDGVPTQHIRCVVLWIATAHELGDATTLEICGDEWDGHVACTEPLLERLAAHLDQPAHPSRHILHGMVNVDGQKVASSEGTPLRVDDIVAWIATEAPARLAADRCCDACGDELGDVAVDPASVALGYFLTARPRDIVEFGRDKLFERRVSPGWMLALARRHATHPAAAVGDPLDDPDYRFTLVRSSALALYHRHAVESFDVSDLARSVAHFAAWFVERPRGPETTAAAGRLIVDSEAMLGLTPVGALAGSGA